MKSKILALLLILALVLSLSACAGEYVSSDPENSEAELTGTSETLIDNGDNDEEQSGNNITQEDGYRAIAYVTVPASENWRWIGKDTPEEVVSELDTRYVTHINFAFGMIKAYQFDPETPGRPLMDGNIASSEAYKDPSDGQYHYRVTLDGWIEEMSGNVSGGRYLKALVELKKQKTDLKVLLSVGGWDSDGFCYMARTGETRAEFIQSLVDIIREYGLDGIDLDWEFPTNAGWGELAGCNNCVEDGRALLTECRAAFETAFPDDHKLLTIASGASVPWVDGAALGALDYINVMCYDFDPGSGGNMAGLDLGSHFMESHAKYVGDTPEHRAKLNMGVPFYNEGGPYLVPYYKGWNGHVDASPEQTAEKMRWVKENGFGGACYWAYSMDVFEQDVESPDDPQIKILQRTLYETLNEGEGK